MVYNSFSNTFSLDIDISTTLAPYCGFNTFLRCFVLREYVYLGRKEAREMMYLVVYVHLSIHPPVHAIKSLMYIRQDFIGMRTISL